MLKSHRGQGDGKGRKTSHKWEKLRIGPQQTKGHACTWLALSRFCCVGEMDPMLLNFITFLTFFCSAYIFILYLFTWYGLFPPVIHIHMCLRIYVFTRAHMGADAHACRLMSGISFDCFALHLVRKGLLLNVEHSDCALLVGKTLVLEQR